MKICAVIFALNGYKKKYPFWFYNSTTSFKKWHPDIELKIIEEGYTYYPDHRYMVECIINLMEKDGYDKIIKVDMDAIVCGRFDEILDDNVSPIITTLSTNFSADINQNPHQCFCLPLRNILEYSNINSAIFSVNGLSTAKFLYDFSNKNKVYEEAALNLMNRDPQLSRMIRIVDFPYSISKSVYNMRFHRMSDLECEKQNGVSLSCDDNSPIISHLSPFKRLFVHKGMLLNHDGKQIKFFHNFSAKRAYDIIMNTDDNVKKFFEDECNCNLKLPYLLN